MAEGRPYVHCTNNEKNNVYCKNNFLSRRPWPLFKCIEAEHNELKKIHVFPLTIPTLFFGAYPNVFMVNRHFQTSIVSQLLFLYTKITIGKNGKLEAHPSLYRSSVCSFLFHFFFFIVGRSDIFQFYLHNGKFCNSVLHLKTAAVTMH